jgi:Glyoxalase/Bleomycin resistance protein/Dioxygenase superfamily
MSRIFGGIRQLAMVVRDAEETMKQWAEVGVGPFYVIRDFQVHDYRYRGKAMPGPLLSLCFAQSGPLQIEVIQQHNDVPSGYLDFLGSGREGCQHVCAWFSEPAAYDAKRAELLAAGFAIIHEGRPLTPRSRFAYFATKLPGAMMFEISESLLPELAPLWEMVESSAANWDGSDPIRHLPTA